MLLWIIVDVLLGCLWCINCCCKVIKLSSSWEIWGVSGELLYDLSE